MHRYQIAQDKNVQPGNMIGDKQRFFRQRRTVGFFSYPEYAGDKTEPLADNRAGEITGVPVFA